MKLIAPFGFYGAGNIGDEATLQGFASLLARSGMNLQVAVASRNPRHTRRVEPSFKYFASGRRSLAGWWARRSASAVVFPGGTPIMDNLGKWPLSELTPIVEDGRASGRPVLFIGVGTERLERLDSIEIMRNRIAPAVRHWTVRSERDAARLRQYGVAAERVTVAADMAWLLNPVSPDWGRQRLNEWGLTGRRLMGVNVLAEPATLRREPDLFPKLAALLDDAVERHGLFVLFLANEVRSDRSFDSAVAASVRGLMKHQDRAFIAPNEYVAPQQMMSVIANCHVTVSMRYHFCLFSALQGVPFIAMKRSDKVADLCDDLKWPYGVAMNPLEPSAFAELLLRVEEQREDEVGQLATSMSRLAQAAERNAIALQLLDSKGEITSLSMQSGAAADYSALARGR